MMRKYNKVINSRLFYDMNVFHYVTKSSNIVLPDARCPFHLNPKDVTLENIQIDMIR